MSRSSTNALAQLDHNDVTQTARIFTTALVINVSLGILGGLLIVFLGTKALLSTHDLSAHLKDELRNSAYWIAPILPLNFASGVSIGALDARERFLLSNFLQTLSNSLGLLVPLFVAIFISPELQSVIQALFWTRLATTLTMLTLNIAEFRPLRSIKFDPKSALKLLHFGGWITVTNLIGPLMTSLDQFIVGGILGVKSVAYYSVPMNAATRLQLFSTTLSRTLFPTFSRIQRDEAQKVAEGALATLSFLSAMIYAPTICALTPILTLWLGKGVAVPVMQVAPILFLGAWLNGLAIIPYSLIQGQGRPDLVAKIHVCEVLPYFGSLWIFVHWLGISGVALAWTLRVAVDLVALWIAAKLTARTGVVLVSSIVLLAIGLAINIYSSELSWGAEIACSAALFFHRSDLLDIARLSRQKNFGRI